MKKSMLIATCALLLLAAGCNDKNKPETITGNVAAPAWTAPEKYDMTSSMTAIIRVDLAVNYPDQVAKAQWQVAEGDVLAAFSGETCLGVAELVDGLYYLYITAPSEGTNVKLKYYSAALKNIEHGGADGKRAVFQQTLLRNNAKANLVVTVVEVHVITARLEHQIQVELPAVIQTDGVEGIDRERWLVERASSAVVERKRKVGLVNPGRSVERPYSGSWRCRDVRAVVVVRVGKVDVLYQRHVVVAKERPLRYGILAALV